jgi:hypothetical protein
MLKELTTLGTQIGRCIVQLNDAGGDGIEMAEGLEECYDEFVEALAKRERPDAERAALMLLSAGQALYGSIENETDETDTWREKRIEAEKLLGIVPLENA